MKTLTIAAFCLLYFSACTQTGKQNVETLNADTMVLKDENANWDRVDFGAPTVTYEEILLPEIEVRGNDSTSIYSIDENVLFGFDKSEIRDSGNTALNQIAASIKKRYPDGAIGIYGYTDSIGSKEYNKGLSEDRADAVKNYLQQQTSLDLGRINTYARGESNPVATNATEAGRQENRRVDIVAQKYHNP